MARIALIDTSLRDGHQSLWGATALNSAMMLEIAPALDQVGFAAVDVSSSTHMAMAVRFHREDPWERIRLMRAAMPRTPLSFMSSGMRFISWETAHPEVMRLSFERLVAAGIGRFQVADPMNDMAALIAVADMIGDAGGVTVAGLVYTISPVHTDAYYAERAARLARSAAVSRLYLKDPGGLLTPDRARSLIPALRARIGTMPLELHSHCTVGLAPFSYVEAARQGIDALHVGCGPLANGSAQPAAERVAANLRELGHAVDIDAGALGRVGAYLHELAAAEGLPAGQPQDCDLAYFRHQVPGGMISTMRRQLAEIKQAERLPEVLEEVARVRAELGYPIMVTPLSQVVGTQAVMNLMTGQRYATIPDEVIRYVIGRFGQPTSPVDPAVTDRIMALPRTRELAAEPPMPGLAELRRKIGPQLPDEEFLLRAVMPAGQVDAMRAAGPCQRSYAPAARPLHDLLRALADRPTVTRVVVDKPGFHLELDGRG